MTNPEQMDSFGDTESEAAEAGKSVMALHLRDLEGGGIQQVMLRLVKSLIERGWGVDLVLNRFEGELKEEIPEGVRVVVLQTDALVRGRWLALRIALLSGSLSAGWLLSAKRKDISCLPGLTEYLQSRRPLALFAASPISNALAVWAKQLANVPTRVLVSEHSPASVRWGNKKWSKRITLSRLMGVTYPRADAIVAVSRGVGDDLATLTGLARERITTIYNPVVTPEISERSRERAPHPWLEAIEETPVIVAAGRLGASEKNLPLLLRAFSGVRGARNARLVVFGEGDARARLESLAHELGIALDVDFPGFIANPYAAFARASVFVLSSDYEGLGNVLIEALACGCPVVSTDCPSGPREILDGGRYGTLVPVGNVEELATAILRTLDAPLSADELRQRARGFSVDRATDNYLSVIVPDLTVVTNE